MGQGKRVVRFVEKPSLDKAREYIAADNFLWNSGIFCFKAGVILDEMAAMPRKSLLPPKYAGRHCRQQNATTDTMLEIPTEAFASVPDISIDYAVMERSANVAVVPADFGWSDIGSWNAVSELIAPDADGNRAAGEAVFVDSRNTFVQSEDRLVAAVGVNNLMIIDTPDALLVAHPDKRRTSKKLSPNSKSRTTRPTKLPYGRPCREPPTRYRRGRASRSSASRVKPGGSLGLQMHHHRKRTLDRRQRHGAGGQWRLRDFCRHKRIRHIPAGHQHRLENPGVMDLVMIEVQSGEYLGEDDIVRFQDVYGRT